MGQGITLEQLAARLEAVERSIGEARRKVVGWSNIADALGDDFSPEAARQLAKRSRDPLPVFRDAAHHQVFAFEGALKEWRLRQILPYDVRR